MRQEKKNQSATGVALEEHGWKICLVHLYRRIGVGIITIQFPEGGHTLGGLGSFFDCGKTYETSCPSLVLCGPVADSDFHHGTVYRFGGDLDRL